MKKLIFLLSMLLLVFAAAAQTGTDAIPTTTNPILAVIGAATAMIFGTFALLKGIINKQAEDSKEQSKLTIAALNNNTAALAKMENAISKFEDRLEHLENKLQ
jgi:uncharacterized protein YggE